jgi:hypothetical protein
MADNPPCAALEGVPSDARSMIALAEATGDRWLGGLVVHCGRAIQPLRPEHSIWSMPVHRLFG